MFSCIVIGDCKDRNIYSDVPVKIENKGRGSLSPLVNEKEKKNGHVLCMLALLVKSTTPTTKDY